MKKNRTVRFIEGKEVRGDDLIEYFFPKRNVVSHDSQRE